MYIHEAIRASDREFPCITRESWMGMQDGERRTLVCLCPTNTPNNVLIEGGTARTTCRGWQPRLDDLVANDWLPADGIALIELSP